MQGALLVPEHARAGWPGRATRRRPAYPSAMEGREYVMATGSGRAPAAPLRCALLAWSRPGAVHPPAARGGARRLRLPHFEHDLPPDAPVQRVARPS